MRNVSSKEESAQEPKGGESGITPPRISKRGAGGGEDKAIVSLWVDWGDGWSELVAELEQRQKWAKEHRTYAEMVRSGVGFLVRPGGYRMGGKGVFLPYVVEHQGIAIGIGEKRLPITVSPNGDAQVGSLPLMEWGGLEVTWPVVKALIAALGGVILREQVRRIDMCCDLVGVSVSEFEALIAAGHLITRVRKESWHRELGQCEGFMYGRKSMKIRIYDKLKKERFDARKLQILITHRWKGLPVAATRVEFELLSGFFRRRRIESVEDYLRCRGAISEYLTHPWWRLAERPVDRTNTSREKIHPLWLMVVDEFRGWTGDSAPLPVVRESYAANAVGLLKQAVGCIGSMVVVETDGRELTNDEFIKFIYRRFNKLMQSTDVQKLLRDKRRRWSAAGPSTNSKDWRHLTQGNSDGAA